MLSPKKKTKYTLSMCRMATAQCFLLGDKTWAFEQEEKQRSEDQ
ncbi:unnamed protein product, partial [Staurois parvus]